MVEELIEYKYTPCKNCNNAYREGRRFGHYENQKKFDEFVAKLKREFSIIIDPLSEDFTRLLKIINELVDASQNQPPASEEKIAFVKNSDLIDIAKKVKTSEFQPNTSEDEDGV